MKTFKAVTRNTAEYPFYRHSCYAFPNFTITDVASVVNRARVACYPSHTLHGTAAATVILKTRQLFFLISHFYLFNFFFVF